MHMLNIAGERKGKASIKLGIYALLILLTLISMAPIYLMLINATRASADIQQSLSLLPGNFALRNYGQAQSMVNLWLGFKNSLLITVPFTLLSAYASAYTAYGFAVYSFRGRSFLFSFVVATMMVPSQLGLLGYFELCDALHLLNTFFPLIISGAINSTTVFFVTQYTKQALPKSLVEAARIDGASELHIFHRVGLPIMMPSIATMSIFNFVFSWNNLMGPIILLSTQDKQPLPVLIAIVRGAFYSTDFGALYFAIAISIVPIIIVYAFCSRHLISGLTMGAIKE